MSFVSGTSMFSQFFVSRALLTQITDLTAVLSLPLFSGKIGLKFVGVLIALNLLIVSGSCISIMSQVLSCTLLSRSRCAFSDLFRLICGILREGGGSDCMGWVCWVRCYGSRAGLSGIV